MVVAVAVAVVVVVVVVVAVVVGSPLTSIRIGMNHDPKIKALEERAFLIRGLHSLKPKSAKARMQLAHSRSAVLLVKHCHSPAGCEGHTDGTS